MKNRKNRKQREEVRKILHTMRLELAARRLAQEKSPKTNAPLEVGELFARTREV